MLFKHMLKASYTFKLNHTALEISAEAVIHRDLRIVTVEGKSPVFVQGVLHCESVVVVQRVLTDVLPKFYGNWLDNLLNYLLNHRLKPKIVENHSKIVHRVR
jgi:hypothetical protein